MEQGYLTTVQAERARRDLTRFLQESWKVVEPHTPYQHNWHVDLISEYLMAVTLGEIKRLIINICPRIGKSRHITTAWPVWEWIENPQYRYLFSSYSKDLARDHSRERRLIIESDWYQERWGSRFVLQGDQNVVTYFANNMGGRMQARGTSGAGTGKGGSRVIVDDPHNVKQAESAVQREQALHDFDKNLSTRLDDPTKGAIVLVMQRLHYNDLTGHILSRMQGWTHVVIPTIQPKDQVYIMPRSGKEIERKKDQVLMPSRQDDAFIQEQKMALGSNGFAAQHQQDPAPEGGNRIKLDWFPRYKYNPGDNYKNVIISWDTGLKPKDTSAPSVGLVFGEFKERWRLIDIYRDQVGYPELRRQVIKKFNKYLPTAVLIEDKASGISLIQELKADYARIPVIAIEPEADKVTRMETQSPHVEAGQIELPEENSVSWLADFQQEIMFFPDPPFWDQIDALSQFLKYQYGRKREIIQTKLTGL